MTPVQVVFVPIAVPMASGNVGWAKRALPPQYPRKRDETWPLHQSIPTDEARRQLDSAHQKIANERETLQRFAREGRVS
jgi:hypothetical protein